jgi:hypothetical protein
MKTLFETLTVLALIVIVAVSALWLQQAWTVTVNGSPLGSAVPAIALIVSMVLAIGLVVGQRFGPTGAEPPAASAPELTRDVQRRPALNFTVHQGRRYKAAISLSFFEQVASNDMIADMLKKAGFTDVSVSGSGGSRRAEAMWPGPDRTAEMPPQIVSASEVPAETPPAAA